MHFSGLALSLAWYAVWQCVFSRDSGPRLVDDDNDSAGGFLTISISESELFHNSLLFVLKRQRQRF